MTIHRSPRLLVLTQDAAYGGGVGTINLFLQKYLASKQIDATMAYLAADKTLSWKKIQAGQFQVEHTVQPGRPNLAELGSFPYLEPFAYWMPRRFLSALIKKHQRFLVASGYATLGYPFVQNQVDYLVWIATTFDSERKNQIGRFQKTQEKLVYALNNWLAPLIRRQEKQVLLNAQKVYVTSRATQNEVAKIGVLPDRVDLLYPPTDTDFFVPLNHDFGQRAKLIYVVARLDDPRKNISFLLRAFQKFNRKYPEFKLVMTGTYHSDLKDEIQRLDLQNKVELTGKISEEQKRNYFQQSLISVLPSWQEGFGIVLVEANACGTPVVATRSGGPADIVKDGENGILTGFSEEEFTQAMEEITQSQELWTQMSYRGRERAVRIFSHRECAKRLDQALGLRG